MDSHKREYEQPAKKPCKKCGSTTIAWRHSTTKDKWYLVEIFKDGDGETFTENALFHSKFCGLPDEHAAMQFEILADAQREREQREQTQRSAVERAAENELERLFDLENMCEDTPEKAEKELQKRQEELAAIERNPTSMDYFTDHMRERARVEILREEIGILEAGLEAALKLDV